MRTAPSDADQRLIGRLAEEDLRVSPTQLERWRRLGLIPRARVIRPRFGGSTVLEHDEVVLKACALLSQVSTRGRPWQYAARELYEEGFDLSTPAVRNAAAFLLERGLGDLRRAWRRAEVGADPPGQDPGEWVADVATEAAQHAGRANRRVVREEVALANPTLAQEELRDAAQRALVWRIADINVPMLLTPEQRQWARTGTDDPLDPLSPYPFPLPSERAACVTTLTWAEASLARLQLRLESFEGAMSLLEAATWRVTAYRLDEHFAHPERPLDSRQLQNIRNLTLAALDEAENDPSDSSDTGSAGGPVQ